MKNVFVKNTFLKTSDVNTTTALSTYSTPHPLSTSQKNEIYCFDSLNYCLRHWAAVWFVNRPFTASNSRGTKPPRLSPALEAFGDRSCWIRIIVEALKPYNVTSRLQRLFSLCLSSVFY